MNTKIIHDNQDENKYESIIPITCLVLNYRYYSISIITIIFMPTFKAQTTLLPIVHDANTS